MFRCAALDLAGTRIDHASVADHRAVVVAAVTISPFIPMVLTAAGAAPPARVLVMGAGVAGMQCHHHRLAGWGAYDVRLEAAEEVSQPRGRHLWAFAAITASPGARVFYDARRAGGDTHSRALRALANRLVGVLHGCLPGRGRDGQHPYPEGHSLTSQSPSSAVGPTA
jgi:hypothetical protein